jgi:hypothetical protein
MSAILGFRPPPILFPKPVVPLRARLPILKIAYTILPPKQDRQELSEALIVQGEMREHERYVGEGDVFPMSYNNANVDASMNERGDNSNPRTSPWRNENQFAWGDDQSSMGV